MYLICNIYVKSKISNQRLQNGILKTAAYHSKLEDKFSKVITYKYTLIPFNEFDIINDDENFRTFCSTHIGDVTEENIQQFYALYSYFYDYMNESFSVNIVSQLQRENIDVFYTDGSSCKSTQKAGYGVVKLLTSKPEECIDIENDKDLYETFYGSVDSGTNNIGELTGLQVAIGHSGDKEFQLIISDSEYALKSFREWIYTWKENNYKTSSRKDISNKDIILSIENVLEHTDKMYLFQWTKSHNDDKFNELCDELAKKGSGIL